MGSEAVTQPADVGVLFVHGIGSQRKGEGLNEAGNALLRWFRALTQVKGFEKSSAEIGTVTTWLDQPANAELRLSLPHGEIRHWVLAESHWANVFLPPTIASTLRWTFTVSPGLLLSRAVESLAHAFAAWSGFPLHWWRILIAAMWLVAVVPVSLALIVLLSVLILFRFLIPIAGVRDGLAKLEVLLTSSLGDSFLFSENAMSRGAMVSKVRSEIDWLADRSNRVIVVAHSQGAAVAVHALEVGSAVDTLITFGAGISQLQWVRSGSDSAATSSVRWLRLIAWVGLLLVVGVATFQFVRLALGEPLEPFLWAVTLVGWVPLVWFSASIFKEVYAFSRVGPGCEMPTKLADRWWDIWASADPVSGGPSTSWTYRGVSEFRALNAGNVLTDHTAYYNNADDFVARIAIAGLIPPAKSLRPSYSRKLQSWAWRRSTLRLRRGRWLEIWRLSMLALFAAVALRFYSYASEQVGNMVDGLPLPPDWEVWTGNGRVQVGMVVLALGCTVAVCYWLGLLYWKVWAWIDADSIAAIFRGAKPLDNDRQITNRLQLWALTVGAALPWVAVATAVAIFFGASTLLEFFGLAVSALGVGILVYILSLPLNAFLRRIVVRDPAVRLRLQVSSRHAWLIAVPVWSIIWACSLVILDPDEFLLATGSMTWAQTGPAVSLMLPLTWLTLGLRVSRGTRRQRPNVLLRFVRNPATYQPVKYRVLDITHNRVEAAGVVAVLAFQVAVIVTLPLMSDQAQNIAVAFAGLGGFFFVIFAVAVAVEMDTRWGKIAGAVAAAAVLGLSVGVFVRVYALIFW
ncbi:hypothetical protein [Cryobacterium sp. HLT2-28]|uniref:hypothetical protein n=1 Tax=Cryobacterium sp. HLT2-28 TaxID=1259146 RepID=UPI00106CC631|nr:hypothetical protein [Cryobacterium sp. HLT2-28]TFB93198.1 hypothetical protein E3O48_11175 [Cryobacterium sp. HLT2-28]